MYATLYPDHIDAQMICEMGIKEVVYLTNEYKEYTFAKASKKILESVKCRYVYIKNVNYSRINPDSLMTGKSNWKNNHKHVIYCTLY